MSERVYFSKVPDPETFDGTGFVFTSHEEAKRCAEYVNRLLKEARQQGAAEQREQSLAQIEELRESFDDKGGHMLSQCMGFNEAIDACLESIRTQGEEGAKE